LRGGRWSLTGKIWWRTGMVKIIGEIRPRRIVLGLGEIGMIPPT